MKIIKRKEAEKLAREMVEEHFPEILKLAREPKIHTDKYKENVWWEICYATEVKVPLPKKRPDSRRRFAKMPWVVIVHIDKKTGEKSICTSDGGHESAVSDKDKKLAVVN